MRKKVFWAAGAIATIALVAFMAAPSANAVTDPITSVTVADGYSTTLGATTNYELTVVFGQTLPAGTIIGFDSRFNGSCSGSGNCGLDFSGASISGLSGTTPPGATSDRLAIELSNSVSGTKTITLNNVINGDVSGMYLLGAGVQTEGSEPGQNPSAAVFLGSIAVKGAVKMPDGTPAWSQETGGVNVNVRSDDFTVNIGSNVDQNGYFAIPTQSNDEWAQGSIVAGGTYFLEIWTGNMDGVVPPDPVSFVYNGTMITKNLTLVAAKKTINVTVRYDEGDTPVTTANIWANKRDGAGGVGSDVDAEGKASFSVSGGTWEIMVNCGWDPELNQPMDCDWTNNEPPKVIEFSSDSSVETEDVLIEVKKTNAKIKGTVYLPDGVTPLPGGFVDIRAGERGGAGTGINQQDGTFIANVGAGDYKLSVHPDEWQNPDMAKYYMDEISVRVGEDETKTLTIVMKEKSSKIVGTVIDNNGVAVANVWINSWKRNGQGWANVQSGADGSFSMWVSAGEWEVNVDTHRPPGEGETSSYIPADNKPVSVTIDDNETVSGISLTVQLADATVSVKMVDASGNAISDFWGYAFCRKVGAGFGPGAEFGSGVNQGTATIPLLGGFTYTCGTFMPPETDFSLNAEVEVDVAVGDNKEIKLTLVQNDSAIVGWVKDQNGKVVTGLAGEVFAVEAGSWQWRPGKMSTDGSFRINVLGGDSKKYMVGVHFWDGNSGYMETHPEPDSAVSVPASTEVTKIVTVFKADTSISGTVTDPDGNPMPHVWVNAGNWKQMDGKMKGDFEGGKPINAGTETRGDGTYTIDIVSGEYTVNSGLPPEFDGNLMSPEEVEVTVTAASPATGVDLQYRQADAFVAATVAFEDGTTPQFGWCYAWSEDGGHSGKEVFAGTSRIPLTAGTWWVGCDSHSPSTNKFYRSGEQQIKLVKGDEKAVSFTLQEESFTIPESFSQTFTATQQNNFTMPDGTTVSIPANAAGTDDSTYTFIGTPATSMIFTDSDKPLRYGWDYEITKVDSSGNSSVVESFNSNVTICMPIPEDYLTENDLTVDDIFTKYWDTSSGAWKLPDSVVVTDDGFACLQVSHFTEFALTTGATFGAAAAGASGGPAYVLATPISNGGPQVTAWDADGSMKMSFFAYSSSLRIGIQALAGDLDGDGTNEIIVAPGAGAGPQIRIFNLSGEVINQFFAFSTAVRTGVKIAVADVTGDGNDNIIVTTMAGAGPQVRIFDADGDVVSQFWAYAETFRGGVNMATGDVDGDGVDEIVVAPYSDAGPQIRVFDYDGTVVSQFWAYASTIRGGYHLATGDVDGDGTADVVVSPAAGNGPQVAMFTGTGDLIGRFFGYASTFRGGSYASVGDVDGDGTNEIVVTPESAAGPQIRVFNTAGSVVGQFWAYASTLRGSFTSVIADVNSDGVDDIVTAPGAGMGPHVRAFDMVGSPVAQYFTHHTGFRGGISVSTVPVF